MAAIDLCTLAQVRGHAQFPDVETEQDPLIADLITRFSRIIMQECGREFAPATAATARTVQFKPQPCGITIIDLRPWELRTVTIAVVDDGLSTEATLAATSYELGWHDRLTGTYLAIDVRDTYPLTSRRRRTLTVTGDWGCTDVPEPAEEACIEAVVVTLRGSVQAFGSAIQPNSLGEGVNDPVALPPGIRGKLRSLMRKGN